VINLLIDYSFLKEAYKNKINQPVLFIGGGEEAAVKYYDLEMNKKCFV
jgi:hypothetical protein